METFPTADELRKLPTLCVSQACDLQFESSFTEFYSTVRLWVSRCGLEDGEPFPNTVYVEVREYLPEGVNYYDLGHYDGDDPPERIGGHSPAVLGVSELVG